jgi:hypothetical protein
MQLLVSFWGRAMRQHPMFIKYTREWLHQETGFSKGYLSRVATGKVPLSRSFVERVCFKLREPEENLFITDHSREKTALIKH